MNFNENPIESNCNETSLKTENEDDVDKKPIVRPKEKRNFCERWLSLFSPWLSRCENDSNRPFCRACQRPLDNNRFRLQRHERTAKHSRNQEILLNEGEDAVRLLLSRGKLRRRCIKNETTMKAFSSNIERNSFDAEVTLPKFNFPRVFNTPIERNKSDSIYGKRECFDITDYYYKPHQYKCPLPMQSQPKKDSFDLFFEAISATVKNLPPKLAAEVKSRISQVVAEFELRAICEKEAKEKAQQSVITMPTHERNLITIDPVITTVTNKENTNIGNDKITETHPTVTQYVYSYEQKKETP